MTQYPGYLAKALLAGSLRRRTRKLVGIGHTLAFALHGGHTSRHGTARALRGALKPDAPAGIRGAILKVLRRHARRRDQKRLKGVG